MSCLKQKQQLVPMRTFCHYVFYNADFNISTLDGLNTFHILGGTSCMWYQQKFFPNQKRLNDWNQVIILLKWENWVLELQSCEKIRKKGLRNIFVEDVTLLSPTSKNALKPSLVDMFQIGIYQRILSPKLGRKWYCSCTRLHKNHTI